MQILTQEQKDRANARRRSLYRKTLEINPNANRERYLRERDNVIKRARKYRIEHPEKRREWARKHNTGCTAEQYNAMLEEQGGKCAICGNEDDNLCADHDHVTGVVRGLLCKKCNWGLGQFADNTNIMLLAIEYLERNKK